MALTGYPILVVASTTWGSRANLPAASKSMKRMVRPVKPQPTRRCVLEVVAGFDSDGILFLLLIADTISLVRSHRPDFHDLDRRLGNRKVRVIRKGLRGDVVVVRLYDRIQHDVVLG